MKRIAGVKLERVAKEYSLNKRNLQVLKDINLNIPDESITVILGKSGCGKTTLLRLIGGLEECTYGKIKILASEYNLKKPKVGIMFQESRLMRWLTVKENINFPLKNKKNENFLVEKYLKLMGLEEFKYAYPNQISGGMAQRVAIARTLVYNPDVILMDEPFAALDYFTRKNLQDEIIKIFLTSKKNIIFITHNVDEAIYIGQKILILDNGIIRKEYSLKNYEYPRDLFLPNLSEIKKDILNILCNSLA